MVAFGPPNFADVFSLISLGLDHMGHVISSWRCPVGMVAGVSGDGPPNCADFFIFWAFDHVSHVISSWRCPATIPTRVSGDGRLPTN